MMLETQRLFIRPLNYDQLVKYVLCDGSLEKDLNINETKRIISPELKDALDNTILPNVADTSRNYLYSTLWTAISKLENIMVADLCIVGEPDAEGTIEIGYGTYDEFQGKGYMTEIVSAIIDWAKTQHQVKMIIASTDKSNPASSRVLEKNGFSIKNETETTFQWKLSVSTPNESSSF